MILLTDCMFPSKYAKWRIEETKAFMDAGCDILVNKIDQYHGVKYDVDYEEMKDYYNLSEYNILIFDPKYNYLNKYNTRLDGIKYNGLVAGYSYMFTKSHKFNLRSYKSVFHIFLSAYIQFNKNFSFRKDGQVIHLYPGGTFHIAKDIDKIHPSTRLISTQPKVSALLRNYKFIECLGSTCLPKNHKSIKKEKNIDKPLRVCFSNMGHAVQKGANAFLDVIDKCKDANIEWHFVGSTFALKEKNKNITYHSPMAQKDLDIFYRNNIDVLLNTENGQIFNGWPLGIEAALQGTVLITTDIHQSNKAFKYTDDMMFIVEPNDTDRIIKHLNNLNKDREMLHRMGQAIQSHSCEVFKYDNQQKRILEFTNE